MHSGTKFHLSTRNYYCTLERMSNYCQSTHPTGQVPWEELLEEVILHITMFFIVYAFKGQVHMFAERVEIVSHSSRRTSAILKYFCPLTLIKVMLPDLSLSPSLTSCNRRAMERALM